MGAVSVNAQNLGGKTVDVETNEPVGFATVMLLKPDSSFVAGTQSDDSGEFRIELKNAGAGDFILKVSCVGYADSYTAFSQLEGSLHVGEVPLVPVSVNVAEIEVKADRIISRANRQVIIPAAKQREFSDNGLDLLNRLNLRGVKIDPLEQTVSKSGGTVLLQINGRKVDMQEFMSIRPSDVLRLDYYDEPGSRYVDNPDIKAIINAVLKQKTSAGGTLALDATNAVTTGFGNNQLSSGYHYGRSTFSLLYTQNRRRYDERRTDETAVFHYPDREALYRTKEGINAPFGYTYHKINAGYNYLNNDRTMLNVSFSENITDRNRTNANTIGYAGVAGETVSRDVSDSKSNAPALDIYLQQQMAHDQTIYANVVGTHIHTTSDRNYRNANPAETLTDVRESVAGDKYSLIGEAIYEKKIAESVVQGGIKYTGSNTKNKYYLQENSLLTMKQSDLYAYAEWTGEAGRLNYTLGAGASHIVFREGEQETDNWIFRPLVRLGYAFDRRWNMNYVFRIRPSVPQLSDLNDIVRFVDEQSLKQGNARLKPFAEYYSSLNLTFDSEHAGSGIHLKYSNETNPIMEDVKWSDSRQRFVYTTDNQRHFRNLNVEAEGVWYLPLEAGSVNAIGGYSFFESAGNAYTHTLHNFYLFMQVQLQYRKMSLAAGSVLLRQKTLYGQTVDFDEKNTQVSLKYRHKSLSATLGVSNPFGGKGWKTSSHQLSGLAESKTHVYIDDNTNMVFFNLSWSFSYGNKYASKKKLMNNSDLDPGIMDMGK
jgi:hypothetical protein